MGGNGITQQGARRQESRTLAAVVHPAVVLVVVAMAAGPAAGHVGELDDARTLQVGEFGLHLNPAKSPLIERVDAKLEVFLLDGAGRELAADAAQLNLTVQAPDGNRTALAMRPSGYNAALQFATWRPAQRGEHVVTATIDGGSGPASANTTFEVFPDLGFRIVTTTPELDPVAGTPAAIVVHPVWSDASRFPDEPWSDLAVDVELWRDDHSARLSTTRVDLERWGTTNWALVHAFEAPGMYHLRFTSESGGFGPRDTPMLHVVVLPAQEAQEPGKDSPTVGFPVGLACLAAALVAVQWARRTN